MRSRLALISLSMLLAAAAIAGCGSDGDADGSAFAPRAGDTPDGVSVIEDWSRALSAGDLEEAATFWKVPSIASNGTPPLALASDEDVLAFNQALPCGADLLDTETDEESGLILATFELTERTGAGAGCGPGVGSEARTLFEIEDGKISVWRRAPDPPGGDGGAPPADGGIV
jgi:hypothetical protein